MSASTSGTTRTPRSPTPIASSSTARYATFESRVRPERISLPMMTTAAVTGERSDMATPPASGLRLHLPVLGARIAGPAHARGDEAPLPVLPAGGVEGGPPGGGGRGGRAAFRA